MKLASLAGSEEQTSPKESRAGWALFITIALSIWALMHAYVFWRLASVPWITTHLTIANLSFAAAILWATFPLARMINSGRLNTFGVVLEHFASLWIGILFLTFSALLAVDAFTLGGLLFSHQAGTIRGWAVMIAALLSVIALGQGLRPPVLREHEVKLAGLPPERDGLTLIAISDLHLGLILGERWIARLIHRINGLRPDLVAIAGDLVDGNVDHVEALLPTLKRLRAPLGVWAVTGNHEHYAGADRSAALLEAAGCRVLRDGSAQAAPGLVMAGVDDLSARREFGLNGRPIEKALAHRPAGAVVYLSHSPWEAEKAAALGAGLMLSGHTHNGQLWPFNYLVRLRYRLLSGRYQVAGMPVIVSRGAGTWGPRMRLWRPGEVLRIKLRSEEKKTS